MREPIHFTGDAYNDISRFMSGQECVNFYLRPFPSLEGGGAALVGTPGLTSWVDSGNAAEVRCVLGTKDILYTVVGSKFYKVTTDGTVVDKGTLLTNSGHVSIATNGLDVTFVDGDNGYCYDIATDTLAQITDLDFPGGVKIVYIAGYYFVNPPNTGQMHQSTINDGSSWPGYFDTAGQDPDDLLDMVDEHSQLTAIGRNSVEAWYNAGLAGFVLTRRPGAMLDIGTPSKNTAVRMNNAVYWLGKTDKGDGSVYQMVGFQPTVISTPAIENELSKTNDLSTAFAFGYEQSGHSFYALTIPTLDKTFVFDSTTQKWHERSSILTETGITRNGRWRANCHTMFNGYNIVGDFENGKLYKLDPDAYDEDGTTMIATRTTGIYRVKQNSFTINELQILMEPGVGLVESQQGDDPVIMLSWSTDGGFTWGTEVHIHMGQIGEYRNRAISPPLGQGRNWVLRMKISDPIKRVVIDAFADIEVDNG